MPDVDVIVEVYPDGETFLDLGALATACGAAACAKAHVCLGRLLSPSTCEQSLTASGLPEVVQRPVETPYRFQSIP